MKRLFLLGLVSLAVSLPAIAQTYDMDMPGMTMPMVPAKPHAKPAPHQPHPAPSGAPQHKQHMAPAAPRGDHADHDMSNMPGMDVPPPDKAHEGHEQHQASKADAGMTAPSGTDLPAGDAPPPPVAHDRSADRFYGATAMAEAEDRLMSSHGGMTYHQVMFNLAEYQARKGRDGYRWAGEGWFGGDINRFVVKSEGEGSFRRDIDAAEMQALYSRAIDPYWNLQIGVRQDFGSGPGRTYAVVGVEGLAPYWFETDAALFVSNKGDLLARVEGYYDQRITQRLVLQPRAEIAFAAQDIPESRIGSGVSAAELGLRLRYEMRREFAPYVGLSWERRIGDTARFARLAGEDVESTSFVAGIRFWF
ncbi:MULTISPECIES: copper resistance protein B [Sphingobium]|uniref:Copper resistance protein CopB n=1 Tax=Sphingobium chungbukense TaxID=56193 RepID=A0A0M3AY54_9SPHN|nr:MULTISPECIES: copper resistance protein B [Sphingobium]KKW93509.1 copper resistance protein CopB [Sphingobium chungbukense]PJG47986.1 copper resistance protein B [Sphingobium sp. LB126]